MEMKRTKDERPPLNEYVLGVWPTANAIPDFITLRRKRSGEYVNRHN